MRFFTGSSSNAKRVGISPADDHKSGLKMVVIILQKYSKIRCWVSPNGYARNEQFIVQFLFSSIPNAESYGM